MRSAYLAIFASLLTLVACSSDGGSTPAGVGGGTASGGSPASGGTAGSGTASGGAAGSVAMTGGASNGGSSAGGATGGGGEGTASEDCQKYCTCMSTNCAMKTFTPSCLEACATQTKWDLACRTQHCGLAPAQPDNGHCNHAVGENECLDTP